MKTAYINGNVYTGEGWADGFIVEDGKFLQVHRIEKSCESTDAAQWAEDANAEETVDLKGRFVCAGFNDSHMHLLNLGNLLSIADLNVHTASLQEMLEYLREYIEEVNLPKKTWIRGRGFNHDYFRDENRLPNRYDLDKVSTEYPICVTRTCGHICAVNSLALEMIGVDRHTPQVEGGSFTVDENGEPTGIFFENAMELVTRKLPEFSLDDLKTMIRKSCRKLNSYGITSCQTDDYLTFPNVDYHMVMEAMEQMEEDGTLTVRVNEQAQMPDLESMEAYIREENHKRKGTMFQNGPMKLLGDGSLGARTAYLSRTYADDPSTRGIPIYTAEQLNTLCSTANRAGISLAIHSIGDGALDSILDAYENAVKECPNENCRHGIVHCQITRKDQIERMKRLGLHVYLQSIFLDYDIHIVRERVGEELASTSYQAATLLKEGITISNGSDAPVEDPVVMKGIQCAVTRQNISGSEEAYLPEEALSVEEAINSFTKYGAYASFEEDIKGCVKEGMFADFVVLGEDPFVTEKHKISQIPIEETWLGGVKVY